VHLCFTAVNTKRNAFFSKAPLKQDVIIFLPTKETVEGLWMSQSNYFFRTALFWVVTQEVVVIPYQRFGTTYQSHLKGLKDGIGCPETSVRNYHYSLHNNPDKRNSHIPRGGSRNSFVFFCYAGNDNSVMQHPDPGTFSHLTYKHNNTGSVRIM
jgi:hypothetical protein